MVRSAFLDACPESRICDVYDEDYDQLADRVSNEGAEQDALKRRSWKEWAEKSIENGGRLACNFAKGPNP